MNSVFKKLSGINAWPLTESPSIRWRSVLDRQAYFEARVAGLGCEFDFAAVSAPHNAIADHQAQARSRPDAFGGVERLKNMRLHIGWNTAAVVGDLHHHLVVIQKRGDTDFSCSFDRVNGIVEQIGPHLVEFPAISQDPWNRAIVLARDSDVLEFVPEHRQRVLDSLMHVDFLDRKSTR